MYKKIKVEKVAEIKCPICKKGDMVTLKEGKLFCKRCALYLDKFKEVPKEP